MPWLARLAEVDVAELTQSLAKNTKNDQKRPYERPCKRHHRLDLSCCKNQITYSNCMAPSSSPWRCVVLAIFVWVSCPAFPAFQAPRTPRTQRQVLNRPGWIPWQGTLSSPQDSVNIVPQREAWEDFMAAMVGAPDGPSLLSQSAANMHCMLQNVCLNWLFSFCGWVLMTHPYMACSLA